MKSKTLLLISLIALSSCTLFECNSGESSDQQQGEDIQYRNQVRHEGRRAGRKERMHLRHKDRGQNQKEEL